MQETHIMKNNTNLYRVRSYSEFTSDHFPVTFQPFYVNYINQNLQGEVVIFQIENSYLCLVIRKKKAFTFAYLVSEIYANESGLINNEEFYAQLKHFLNVKSVVAVFPPLHLHTYKIAPVNAKSYKLGIIELDLSSSKEALFSGLKPVYRRHIRNAVKEGVKVEFGMHLFDAFYTFYETRMIANNAVYDSKEVLKKIIDKAPQNVVCAVAKLSNNIEAVILNIHDGTTAYYMWGASDQEAHNGSFRLLHWELIQFYHSKGIQRYSLGGYRSIGNKTEKQEKLESFKMGFGSKIKDGYHFLWVLKPFPFFIYNTLSILLQKLRK